MTISTPISDQVPVLGSHPVGNILHCCSRTYIDFATVERLKTLLQENINWEYLIDIAIQHGVMPLLYWNLNKNCPEKVPDITLRQLRDKFEANAGSNLFLTGELLKLLELFASHDIPAIPFKGAALTASAYGNLAFRQFSDLDILVHKQDTRKAKELLIFYGYQLTSELFWENQFISEDGRVNIDLHRQITPRFFSFSLNFDELWKRLQPVSLTGASVLTLSPEDSLLILCVYLARDCWQHQERLIQICDIAELLRTYQEQIDWEQLLKQATELGSQRMLFLGLFLAHTLLEAAIPEEIWQKIQVDSVVQFLAVQVCDWLFLTDNISDLGLERKLFYIRVRERRQDIIPHFPYLIGYWITPSQTDRDFFPLPDSLSFLYYLVRQLRLVGQYGLRLFKRLLRF